MANLIKWSTTSTGQYVNMMTTSLSTLANAALATSTTTIANSQGLRMYSAWELNIGSTAAAWSAGAYFTVYIQPTLDGTNYAENNKAELQPLVTFQGTTSTANAQHRIIRSNIILPPIDFGVIVENQSGQSLSTGSGLNTLSYIVYDINDNG